MWNGMPGEADENNDSLRDAVCICTSSAVHCSTQGERCTHRLWLHRVPLYIGVHFIPEHFVPACPILFEHAMNTSFSTDELVVVRIPLTGKG